MQENGHLVTLRIKNGERVTGFYQYDRGQYLKLPGVPDLSQVQFEDGYEVIVMNEMAPIPDKYLDVAGTHDAWVQWITDTSETTRYKFCFVVADRNAKQAYTEPSNQQTFAQQMQAILNQAKQTAQSVRDDANAGKFNGATGPQGPQGPQGDDYVLTEDDKTEIAEEVEEKYTTELNGIKQDISSIKTLLQAVRDKLAGGDIPGAISLLDEFLLDGGELA